jgi:O-antigen/teichoic acid export membrane protein
LAQGASLILGFVLWAVAARRLGVDAFGQTQLGVAVGTYLALVVSAGLSLLGISELAAQTRVRAYVVRVQGIRLAHAFAVMAALTTTAFLLPKALPGVIALCAASVALRELWPEWADIALGASRRVVLVRTAYFVVVLPSSILLVHSPSDALLFCGILAVGAVAVGFPSWYFTLADLRRRERGQDSALQFAPRGWGAVWTSTLQRSLPLGAAGALGQLVANADILILGALASATAVAQYGAAYRIVFAIQGIGVALRLSSLKAVAEPGPGRDRYEQDLVMATFLASVAIASAWAVLAVWAVPIAFGPSYADSIPLLRILVWSCPLDFASAILLNALVVRGKRRRYIGVMSVACGVNLAANALVIPRFGAAGAAVVTVVSLALLLAVLVRGIPPHQPAIAGSGRLLMIVTMALGLGGSFAANAGLSVVGGGLLAAAAIVAAAQFLRLYGSRVFARILPRCR